MKEKVQYSIDMSGSDPRVVITEAKISASNAIRAALDRLRVRNPDSETVKRLMEKAEYRPWPSVETVKRIQAQAMLGGDE